MRIAGYDFHVEDHPASTSEVEPPVLLLHGFAASTFTWRHLVAPLHDGGARRVIAFDHLGFGRSDRPRRGSWIGDTPYSFAAAAHHTTDLVDGLDLVDPVLVGHSAGCAVAALAMIDNGLRASALVLIAPAVTGGGPPPIVRRMFEVPGAATVAPALLRATAARGLPVALRSVWGEPAGVTDDVVAGYTAPFAVPGWAEALVEMTVAPQFESLVPRLGAIDVPTLVVAGERDRVVSRRDADLVTRALRDAQQVTIAGAGHLPHEEAPEETSAAILEFLRASDRG